MANSIQVDGSKSKTGIYLKTGKLLDPVLFPLFSQRRGSLS
jgi:hypothetical protein